MRLYRLSRIDLKEYTNIEIARYRPNTKYVCNAVVVRAETEDQARVLASRPSRKYGRRVHKNNTIDIPYASCYDVTPEIWNDSTKTTCTFTGITIPDASESCIVHREFGEVPE